jgi:hypothetical protein
LVRFPKREEVNCPDWNCLSEGSLYSAVDDFVDAKAPRFNKIQQLSTSTPQTIQQQPFRINRKPIGFNKRWHLVLEQEAGGSLAPTNPFNEISRAPGVSSTAL